MLRQISITALFLYKKFYIILDIIVISIIRICIVHKKCIILHFYTSCDIILYYTILSTILYFDIILYYTYYSFLYYTSCDVFSTLQLTRVFSNLTQLKQPSKIMNMCEYCNKIYDVLDDTFLNRPFYKQSIKLGK